MTVPAAGAPGAAATTAIAEIQARIAGIAARFSGGPAFGRMLASAGASPSYAVRGAAAAGIAVQVEPGAGTAADAVDVARRFLGVPYVWGGESPSGFDCSGLVQYAYRQIGVELPRVAKDQARVGTPVASLAEARPGDLVAFDSPVDHIGIYVGDGRMVVAPKTGDVVKIQEVYETPTAIRRVLSGPPSTADLSEALASLPGDRAGILALLGAA